MVNRRELDRKAEELLSNNGIDAAHGFDIVLLAEKMGFIVGNAKLPDDEDGFIAVDKSKDSLFSTSSNMIICVNRDLEYYQKRFVVAHEIGHYILEGSDEQIYAHRKNKAEERSDIEQDVDYFAASLLMPQKAFIDKYKEIVIQSPQMYEIINELQEVFETPIVSIGRRIDELGLADHSVSTAD